MTVEWCYGGKGGQSRAKREDEGKSDRGKKISSRRWSKKGRKRRIGDE